MPEVFGRDAELDALRHFLHLTSEGPCALTLEGEAGIGKTTLWNFGVEYGRERAFQVLTCRSARSEAELSYAGLCDVLDEVPEETLTRLPEVQRHALEVALLRAEPGAAPIDHRTVAAATLGTLRGFASSGPVLIALDDPQWMDEASCATLAYVIRRLDEEPVGVLAAVRVGEGRGDDPLELSRALADERAKRVEVGPLSVQALGRMLDARLGWVPEASVLFELHTVSGGNPLFALEIARASLQDPDRSLVVPRSLHEQVSERLAALPEATREALAVVAALPRPTLGLIERAVDAGDEVLDPAVRAGTLEVRGEAVRFTHPLYGSVAYADARDDDRARIHRRLAELVTDREERARHLALATDPPDARIADALEEAAYLARSRGAPAAAAELCLEAQRYTPEERAEDARRRAVLAADDLYVLGEHRRQKSLLEEVLRESPEGSERAQVLWRLGHLAANGDVMSRDVADEWLDRAESEASDDWRLRSRIHRSRWLLATAWSFRYDDLPGHARSALEMAERGGDLGDIAASLAMLVAADAAAGHGVDDRLVDRAIDAWARIERAPPGSARVSEDDPALMCGVALRWAGRLDEARSMFETLRRESQEVGSEVGLNWALLWLVDLELLTGNWDLAARYVDEAARLSGTVVGSFTRLIEGSVAAQVGRADAARADLDAVRIEAERAGGNDILADVLSRLGFLELSAGNLAEAHGYLARATRLVMAAGIREPFVFPVLPDAIEALLGLGELAEAERHTDWLEERGRTLDRPWALATGARCRGLLCAAKGDVDPALEHLEAAVIEHERLPMPFERARTLLALGTIRRRAKRKREAREALQEALAVFDLLGARLWADKARAELSAIGGRPAATGRLTPTEERVARLAAAGRTNREIAETLYLSVRTVETHLSRTYHKLGVRSRTELAFALDAERPA